MSADAEKAFGRCAPEGHKLIEAFPYPDKDGKPVQFSARYEPVVADGKRTKTFRQFHVGANGEVIATAMPGKKPLYNLPALLANPDKLVLIVEGEGKANRASERFPDLIVTTSIGGSAGAAGTDWLPLTERAAVAWPDHDAPGDRYVAAVRKFLPQLKAVKVPDTWPPKWDLGDDAPEGTSDADLRQMIEGAIAAAEAKPLLPRTTGASGNGRAPTTGEAKRRKAEASAVADRYCDKAGNLVTEESSEEELKKVVADLDDVAFDRAKVAIRTAAGVGAKTLDRIRAEARASGGTPSFPEWAMLPWPEPVPDGDKLADEILAQARRYVAWPGGGAEIFALWVLLAHAFDSFDIVPYLAFVSPTPACGKTTSFKLLARLTPRALIASNISGPAIPRMVEAHQPTLLIDELDSLGKDQAETLRSILNAGHDREGARYTRCEGEANEPRTYLTWCPKALAKIRALPDTLVSRSIIVRMRRRAPSERIERLRPRRHTAHLEELRRRAARWATDHADALRDAEPALPEALFNREADNWTPLLAIADACGADWPERIREVAVRFSGAEEEALGVELLADIRKIHGLHPANAHSSKDLALWLGEMEDRPWAEYWRDNPITQPQLAKMLKPFGIKPGTVRLGAGTIKGYYASAFAEAFARYLAPEPPHEA